MAANTFPKVTAKAWAILRDRAKAAPSVKFTPDMVVALMGMVSTNSARSNTVGPMQRLGLIDEEGALTDRGNKWRVDSSFPAACQEILEEVYPDEIRALVDEDGRPDHAMVKNWFDLQGFGKANATQMAATYVRVASKEIPELSEIGSSKVKKKKSTATKPTGKSPEQQETKEPHEGGAHEPTPPPVKADGGPTVHLDIQIHIPADATPEKIDQIFSSMARHLYAK